jgi:hypothetical protein
MKYKLTEHKNPFQKGRVNLRPYPHKITYG